VERVPLSAVVPMQISLSVRRLLIIVVVTIIRNIIAIIGEENTKNAIAEARAMTGNIVETGKIAEIDRLLI
jgi:uncharacterized protein (UPF0333 family)